MGDPAEATQEILAADIKRGTSLVLRLDSDQGLRRVFSLPSQAEGNLRQVLQHEMDRLYALARRRSAVRLRDRVSRSRSQAH